MDHIFDSMLVLQGAMLSGSTDDINVTRSLTRQYLEVTDHANAYC